MTAHREFSNLVQIEKKTKALYALITQIEIEFHIFPTLFSQAEKNIKMSSMKITICFYRSTKLCALGKENYRRKIWCYRMGSTVRLVPSPIINTIEWSGFCADLLCVEIFKNKILVSARKKKQLFLHFPQVYSTCLPWLSVIKAFFLSRYDLESAFTFEVHVLVTRNLTAFFCMNTSYASKWTI